MFQGLKCDMLMAIISLLHTVDTSVIPLLTPLLLVLKKTHLSFKCALLDSLHYLFHNFPQCVFD